MRDFYIERAFATLTAADERALWRRLESCARNYPVRWRKCLVDAARTRIMCHLEAESVPAARAAALCLGVTRDGVWPHRQTMGRDLATTTTRDGGLVDVMAEWSLNAPTDAVNFARAQNICDECLDALRIRPDSVAASADGRRVVAFFCAPDAESVRHAYRNATVPFDRVTALRQLGR